MVLHIEVTSRNKSIESLLISSRELLAEWMSTYIDSIELTPHESKLFKLLFFFSSFLEFASLLKKI